MTTRRRVVIAFGASALAAPFTSFAQQTGKVPRVGFMGSTSATGYAVQTEALRAGLRDLGYVEGKNIVIEWRFADGNYERLPELAAELVRLKVDVLVTHGTPGTRAAQRATTTIPIVFGQAGDPVGNGFVKSLARPGGNITGLASFASDVGSKHLEILLGVVPRLARLAVLINPGNPVHTAILKDIQAAAEKSGVKTLPLEVRSSQEIENAFSVMTRERAGAVIVTGDPFLKQQRSQIAALATKYRIPSLLGIREYVESGGLMSYGQNSAELYRRAAYYVDRLLKGVKPADLPVEQPTKLELAINLKTAKALGITIPQSVLVRADRVIE